MEVLENSSNSVGDSVSGDSIQANSLLGVSQIVDLDIIKVDDVGDNSTKESLISEIPADDSTEEVAPFIILDFPNEILCKIFKYLSFEMIAKNRIVCKRMNKLCSDLLNSEFQSLRNYTQQMFQSIKSQMPRRESARRKHQLAREYDIIETLNMRLSLLQMTFNKHIERSHCCFFAGEVLDEVHRILSYLRKTPVPNRAYKVTDELFDLSTMAIEYFKECIQPTLPDINYIGMSDYYIYDLYGSNGTPPPSFGQGTQHPRDSNSTASQSANINNSSASSQASSNSSPNKKPNNYDDDFDNDSGSGGGSSSSVNNFSTAATVGSSSKKSQTSEISNDKFSSNFDEEFEFDYSNKSSLDTEPKKRHTSGGGGAGSSCSGGLSNKSKLAISNALSIRAKSTVKRLKKLEEQDKQTTTQMESMKEELKFYKRKLNQSQKQLRRYRFRLDGCDKKFETISTKLSAVLEELSKYKTEIQYLRSSKLLPASYDPSAALHFTSSGPSSSSLSPSSSSFVCHSSKGSHYSSSKICSSSSSSSVAIDLTPSAKPQQQHPHYHNLPIESMINTNSTLLTPSSTPSGSSLLKDKPQPIHSTTTSARVFKRKLDFEEASEDLDSSSTAQNAEPMANNTGESRPSKQANLESLD